MLGKFVAYLVLLAVLVFLIWLLGKIFYFMDQLGAIGNSLGWLLACPIIIGIFVTSKEILFGSWDEANINRPVSDNSPESSNISYLGPSESTQPINTKIDLEFGRLKKFIDSETRLREGTYLVKIIDAIIDSTNGNYLGVPIKHPRVRILFKTYNDDYTFSHMFETAGFLRYNDIPIEFKKKHIYLQAWDGSAYDATGRIIDDQNSKEVRDWLDELCRDFEVSQKFDFNVDNFIGKEAIIVHEAEHYEIQGAPGRTIVYLSSIKHHVSDYNDLQLKNGAHDVIISEVSEASTGETFLFTPSETLMSDPKKQVKMKFKNDQGMSFIEYFNLQDYVIYSELEEKEKKSGFYASIQGYAIDLRTGRRILDENRTKKLKTVIGKLAFDAGIDLGSTFKLEQLIGRKLTITIDSIGEGNDRRLRIVSTARIA